MRSVKAFLLCPLLCHLSFGIMCVNFCGKKMFLNFSLAEKMCRNNAWQLVGVAVEGKVEHIEVKPPAALCLYERDAVARVPTEYIWVFRFVGACVCVSLSELCICYTFQAVFCLHIFFRNVDFYLSKCTCTCCCQLALCYVELRCWKTSFTEVVRQMKFLLWVL